MNGPAMQNNPYVPPVAELKDSPRPPGSPVKAIILGFLADMAATMVGGMVLGFGYAFILGRQGLKPDQIASVLQHQSMTTSFGLVSVLVGTLASFLGGWICGRIVRRNEFRFAAILALLLTLFGLLFAGGGRLPLPEMLVASVLTVVSVMAGAALARSGNKA